MISVNIGKLATVENKRSDRSKNKTYNKIMFVSNDGEILTAYFTNDEINTAIIRALKNYRDIKQPNILDRIICRVFM